MCIRDRYQIHWPERYTPLFGEWQFDPAKDRQDATPILEQLCLLYTSDAADERSSVDLGGRRIIKKKKNKQDDNHALHTKNRREHNTDNTTSKQVDSIKKREMNTQ